MMVSRFLDIRTATDHAYRRKFVRITDICKPISEDCLAFAKNYDIDEAVSCLFTLVKGRPSAICGEPCQSKQRKRRGRRLRDGLVDDLSFKSCHC